MKENHLKKILDKQFKIAKVDFKYEDLCDNKVPNWRKKYSYTSSDNKKWKTWTQKYMKEKLKLTKDKAFIQTAWIDQNYGLKIKNDL